MKTRIVAILALMLALISSQTQASMHKVRLEQLTTRSHTIVVGRVVDVRSDFADIDRKEIVTYVTIAPTDVLKGASEPSLILTIPGGMVGNLGLWVEDTPHFLIGEQALLFVNTDYKGRKTVSEWRQGKFPIINRGTFVEGVEVDIQALANSIRTFISRGETGTIPIEPRKPSPAKSDEPRTGAGGAPPVPSISYITPSSGPAIRPYAINPNDPFNPGDRGTIIDIYGSGFGSTQGTSVVRFYENTANPPVIADAEDYLLWSDTRITCKVPGRQFTTTFLNASSGPLYVVTSGGTSNGAQFTVTFAAPSKRFPSMPVTYYINQNGTPDADGEFQAIQAAFQTWENVPNSRLDYSYGGTTSRVASPSSQDGFNDCLWIESNWPYQSSSIAVNRYFFNTFLDANEIYEFDIFFNGVDFLWTTTGQAGRQDVQNLATHESGHSLNLQDIYGTADAEKTMYGYSPAGGGETKKRTLEADDITGCRYVQPSTHSLSLFNTFEFDGTSGGQVTVANLSQGTNTITYSAPQNRTVNYGTTFQFGALGQQTVNGRDYRFLRWTDYASGLTRNVTITSGASLSPLYKGHLLSGNIAVTGTNAQRKLARGNAGDYHLVYAAGDKIWYSVSTDNGASWATEIELYPYGSLSPRSYPSVAAQRGYVFVVWQEYEGIVEGMHQYRIRGAWKQSGSDWNEIMSYSGQPILVRFATQTDPIPVLTAADNTYDEHPQYQPIRPELMLAWRGPDGIYSAVGNWDVITGGGQVYVWNPYVRFGRITGTSSSSVSPSLGTDFQSRVGLAYEEASKIFVMSNDGSGWSSSYQVSATPFDELEAFRTPSLSVDNSSRLVVAWEYWQGEFLSSTIQVRRKETNGSWGVTTNLNAQTSGGYPATWYNKVPSISAYPTYNDDFAVSWAFVSQNTVQLKKFAGGAWTATQIIGNPGFEPNLSVNESATLDAKVGYRSNSSTPYAIAFTSQYLPNSPLDLSDEISREVRVSGDSFAVRLKLGELALRMPSTTETISFSTFPDTTIVYGTQDLRGVFRTEPFTVGANAFLDFKGIVRVLNSSWVRNNWSNNTNITLAFEAVDNASGGVLGRPLQYSISRNRIPSVSGSASVPLTALAGRTMYLRASVSLSNDLSTRLYAADERIPRSGSMHPVAKVVGAGDPEIPTAFVLDQNFPNPFNPSTQIRFGLPHAAVVKLSVFDVLGREVQSLSNGHFDAGYHTVTWNASDLASGVYFARLSVNAEAGKQSFTKTNRLLLTK